MSLTVICKQCHEEKPTAEMVDDRCHSCRERTELESAPLKLRQTEAELEAIRDEVRQLKKDAEPLLEELVHLRDVAAHGDQPLVYDGNEIRFRENRVIRFLLDQGPFDMNNLTAMGWKNWEMTQLLQLIGWPPSGLAEVPYVDDKDYHRAEESVSRMGEPEEVMTPERAVGVLSGIPTWCKNCGAAYALNAERWAGKACDHCGTNCYVLYEDHVAPL